MDLLLKHGADVAAACRAGKTPLHCAAMAGHSTIVGHLLQASGPDLVSRMDTALWLPLHHAAEQGSIDIARHLLQARSLLAGA